jgi:hypothetical protein
VASNPLVPLPDWYRASDFDPYCTEVGRLTAMWALLERAIDNLIWELLNVEAHKGACLTAQMIGPGPRIRALQALIEETGASDELRSGFQMFGKLASELGGKRNRYSHDTVTVGIPSGLIRRHEITADKKLRSKELKVEIDAIRKLWIEIQAASEQLRSLRFALIAELPLPLWERARYKRSLSPPPPDAPGQG